MNALMALTVMVLAADATPEELVLEANLLLAENDHDGAIGKYAKAQPERQNAPEIDIGLGLAHAGKGDHDKAAEYFATATAKAASVLWTRSQSSGVGRQGLASYSSRALRARWWVVLTFGSESPVARAVSVTLAS